nr:hypothetical protein [Trentepohlia sp. YN1317]
MPHNLSNTQLTQKFKSHLSFSGFSFIPWKNLSIFRKSFPLSANTKESSRIHLEKIISGPFPKTNPYLEPGERTQKQIQKKKINNLFFNSNFNISALPAFNHQEELQNYSGLHPVDDPGSFILESEEKHASMLQGKARKKVPNFFSSSFVNFLLNNFPLFINASSLNSQKTTSYSTNLEESKYLSRIPRSINYQETNEMSQKDKLIEKEKLLSKNAELRQQIYKLFFWANFFASEDPSRIF